MKSSQTTDNKLSRALLVSIRTHKTTDAEAQESLIELERLVKTLGFKVIGKESQKQPSTRGGAVVGEGKLKELARYTGGKGYLERNKRGSEEEESEQTPTPLSAELATIVVFDCDLSPSQMRNVETALGVPVLDRTGVIIEIFRRHARTRSAQIEVEIARQNYLTPRLRETEGGSERHAGRGAGESGLALEKRKVRDRLAELRHELKAVQKEEENRRTQRVDQLCVALVGYTNAGKSSLMRTLTGSDVLVEDKLFATLGTTVRVLQPETPPRILISDTVGFIRKLPHDLVASFRSTLDEARNASLLLYVVDSSDPSFRSQLEVSREVLTEIGADSNPSFLVLNKSDRLNENQKLSLKQEFPDSMLISTRNPDDIRELRERILNFFEKDMVEEEILLPYSAQSLTGELRLKMRVLKETFGEEGVRLVVRARESDLRSMKEKITKFKS